jgi:hypothetical protein
MKCVFDLETELKLNPRTMELTQALTLNPERPHMGLKGTLGLYGSAEWWANIRNGKMRTETITGIIDSTYFAGQDSRWGDQVNSFRLRLDDGEIADESIYCQSKRDKSLFRPDAYVMAFYVFDELKSQPAEDGGINYLKMVLEMAVSTD